ncbi:ribonuclease E/G [Verrucomicrobiota bacterium]
MLKWLCKGNRIKREIIINCEKLETRVAILEEGKLEEFQVEHPMKERIVGSVFKGKIQNLENDLQAAFIDIGLSRNAFLHYWDIVPNGAAMFDFEETGRRSRASRKERFTNAKIAKRFPVGSEIIVQVTKGPIGTKGPRVTASLSMPGRYLVLMPGAKFKGVSRKIEDRKERQRLKKILMRMPLPEKAGLVVRTAAIGARKTSFVRDLRALTATWKELQEAIDSQSAPSCVYQELDLVERVVRDWLTEDVDRIVVDSKEKFEKLRDIASKISRSARSKIHYYDGELPVFDHYDVEHQLEEAFRRKVKLKSGGYIVFDETEALIAVDVNTGRHKGRGSQEEAILHVNTEAVEEVARQLKLRNIGGLVVLDLIDMRLRKHQNAVYRAMKAALKRDRARANVLPISGLGIMEMTRQRVEESILSSMYIDCTYCHGRGNVKSPLSMSVEIQRQISAVIRKHRGSRKPMNLQVVIHPTVLDRLRNEDEAILIELESKFDGHLGFKSDPAGHVERFVISDADTGKVLYLSTDK